MLLARTWQALATTIQALLQPAAAPRTHVVSSEPSVSAPFSFSQQWHALGPFQIGTREAAWGSDPLEVHGGFRALEYNPDASFKSSLALNGTVAWSNITVELSWPDTDHHSAKLDVGFPNIDWQALRDVEGWAAVQWQGWIRGAIIVHTDNIETLHLNTPSLLEVWIDEDHYFGGDFYQYDRAPATLHLGPGSHRINVRLVRDVRSMGGFGDLTVPGRLDLRRGQGLLHLQNAIVMPDLMQHGSYVGFRDAYASAMLRNDALYEIEVNDLMFGYNECVGELLAKVRLLPGQSRPVVWRMDCRFLTSGRSSFHVLQRLKYHIAGQSDDLTLELSRDVPVRGLQEPHKVTFLHPAGVVSYAILRPPSHKVEEAQPRNASLPILIGLHGAGLEAENELVKNALDSLPDLPAWVLFPTGGSPWSGDDWHAWGLADVEASVAMIPDWIMMNRWDGSRVRLDQWLVSGHSNGGQGAWHLLTHRPDNVFAAAVLSGYSSIQNYVPYTFWHVADPGRKAIIHASLSSYRHELLLPNAKGIPLLQQHGSLDDNVPPYHARLMSQLLHDAGGQSEYFEFPHESHVWDGFFATQPLKRFYESELPMANKARNDSRFGLQNFSMVTANPGDTGPKHCVHILQLVTPGQLGRIGISVDPYSMVCNLQISNVRVFHLPPYFRNCSVVLINGYRIDANQLSKHEASQIAKSDGEWAVDVAVTREEPSKILRHGRQLGAMDGILRTRGAFQIVEHTNSSAARHIALQISRNLCQYYAADTIITSDYASALNSTGNIISIAVGSDLPVGYNKNHPIQIHNGTEIYINKRPTSMRYTSTPDNGLAAIYLRALPDERLELVVWGADAASLDVAARLVPMLPGTGQPDFVITDRRMLWKGVEGAMALGFFDSDWEVSGNSFFE